MSGTDGMDFEELRRDDGLCLSMAAGIAEAHSLPFDGERMREGSNILFHLSGNTVLKVFSMDERAFRDNEALFLKRLAGRLSVTVPSLTGTGEYRGHPYLLMERMTGRPLASLWPELDREGRESVCRQAGSLLRELHSLPVALAEGCVPEWSTFISSQKLNLADNHARYGLEPSRIREIVEFVELGRPVEELVTPVICHTEMMREHLFAGGPESNNSLSGLIDFEPSMLAIPQYDLCAAGLFITAGEPGLFSVFLDGYGSSIDASAAAITRMLLLHRYSNMKWFVSTLPAALRDADLLTMGEYWYGKNPA